MKVSDKYLSLVDKFIFMGGSIRHMAMTEEQKLRTLIAYEAYQVWMSNKQIRPADLCRRIAARIYGDMLLRAETDPHESTITFSTDANFTDNGSNFGGGNVAVAGIHLTGGTPATPGEPEAEGIKIYAENKAGFSPLNIYSWDANNTQLTGAWPGTAMTETEVVDGVTYNVITVDAKFKGSQIKVIFNDGTSQTPDSEFFTLDGDLYLVADKVDGKFVAPYEAGSAAVVVDFYLKGSFNEWGGGKAMVKENGLYVAKNVTFTGTSSKWGEFKVTDGASAWYGAAGWDPVVIGQPMNISTSEGNNIQISQDGTFDFYFNKEKSQLCVVNAGAAAPSF